MGFWKGLAKVAVGIAAPGALAGWEYQEAKQRKEMLGNLDEAINVLFKTAAMFSEKDGWSEVLVALRGCLVEALGKEKTREELMRGMHPEEIGRLCCQLALEFAMSDSLKSLAQAKGVDPELPIGCFTIPLLYCKKLDEKLLNCGLTTMELSVVRLAYDLGVTRSIPVTISQKGKTKDDAEGVNNLLRDLFDEDVVKNLCKENKTDPAEIVRKLGL